MPVHNTAGGSSIFFAKVPDFSLLCSVVCRLENCNVTSPGSLQGIHISRDTNEVGQSNSKPTLKCRELIFTESNVLASPSLQDEGCIYVIITSEFWQSGKLQERCQKMNLQVGNPIRVIPAVFQACFTYTIKAKLAPLWNKVGEYYIQGRDFITSTGILGAINLETNVTDDEICFAVKPLTVKMPHCTLQDFGVCPSIINHFLTDINYMISEYGVDDKWCYVLPR
nr:uncharacterized protein C18orf63-like isoform X2 [Lytechinus pictus]